jgi:hypothetical protein
VGPLPRDCGFEIPLPPSTVCLDRKSQGCSGQARLNPIDVRCAGSGALNRALRELLEVGRPQARGRHPGSSAHGLRTAGESTQHHVCRHQDAGKLSLLRRYRSLSRAHHPQWRRIAFGIAVCLKSVHWPMCHGPICSVSASAFSLVASRPTPKIPPMMGNVTSHPSKFVIWLVLYTVRHGSRTSRA